MTKLQILNACGDCGIDDDSLKNLNLVKLNALYNPKIKNIDIILSIRIYIILLTNYANFVCTFNKIYYFGIHCKFYGTNSCTFT